MISKIPSNDYMKRYSNMSMSEQADYALQVQEWQEQQSPLLERLISHPLAGFQNIMQFSVLLNDDECSAFNLGVKLLTPFASEPESWLPDMVYNKTASRVIRRMIAQLKNVVTPQPSAIIHQTSAIIPQPSAINPQPSDICPQTSYIEHQTSNISHHTSNCPIRPKHIDQYVHLLPVKTQERAALVKDLLRQMDIARENERLLMNNENSLPDDRAKWAKMSADCDKEVRKIYKELDKEWEKLVKSGRVTVDELGNARISSPPLNDNVNVNDNDNSLTPNPNTVESGDSLPSVGPQPHSVATLKTPFAPGRGELCGRGKTITKTKTKTESLTANRSTLTEIQPSDIIPQPSDISPQTSDISPEPSKINRRRQLRKWMGDTRRGNGNTREEHIKKWIAYYKEYLTIEGPEAAKDSKLIAAAKHYGIKINGKTAKS